MCRDDLEHGWVGREDSGCDHDEDEEFFRCAWCGEKIYVGEDYYDFDGDRVCKECVDSCARTA